MSGWDLSCHAASDKPWLDSPQAETLLTAGLAILAIDHAIALAATVPASAVPASAAISSRPARECLRGSRPPCWCCSCVCPRWPARTQWRRFADPYGDVPPFSLLQFSVEPGDAQVIYGTDLDVHVTVSGGPSDRVESVFDGGGEAEILDVSRHGRQMAGIVGSGGDGHPYAMQMMMAATAN